MNNEYAFLYRPRVLLLGCALSLLWGCSGGSPAASTVSGKVILDGKPVESGTVLFISAAGEAASVPVGREGAYELKCVPGDYQVAVAPPPSADPMVRSTTKVATPMLAIPHHYQDVNTSGLSIPVSEGANTFDIKMQTAPRAR